MCPADPTHLDYLDGWRGLAIVALLVGHFLPVPGLNFGTVGVDLFFVLSGLLMGRLLFVKRVPIGLFYRRRISRILPAHLFFVAAVALGFAATELAFSWRETWSAAFFLNNYVQPEAGAGHAVMPFGHVWSLSVEEHAYVLLASVAWLTRRAGSARKGLLTALGACVAVSVGYVVWQPPNLAFTYWLHSETAIFGILVSAALVVFPVPDSNLTRRLALLIPVVFALGLLAHWWSVPLLAERLLGLGLLALTIHLLPIGPAVYRIVLSYRPLRQLGLWSFSIYLWQQPFYLWVRGERLPVLVGLTGALLCGLASYYLIEKPVRNRLNAGWASAG